MYMARHVFADILKLLLTDPSPTRSFLVRRFSRSRKEQRVILPAADEPGMSSKTLQSPDVQAGTTASISDTSKRTTEELLQSSMIGQ